MKYHTKIGDREREFTFERKGQKLVAHVNGNSYLLDVSLVGDGNAFSLLIDSRSYDVIVDAKEGRTNVMIDGEVVQVHVEDERERTASAVAGARPKGKRTLKSSMPGVVVEVQVEEGQVVEDGETLLILEAMKMQNPIAAEGEGTVAKIYVKEGDTIGTGDVLVDLDG